MELSRTPPLLLITLILAVPSATASIDGTDTRKERSAPSPSVPNASRTALTALYEAAGGARWDRRDNWLSGDPCDRQSPWFGVGCSAGATVEAIQLGSNGLEGVVPSKLAHGQH